MAGELINLSVEELLKRFGAGGHKPGAGSAVALQAMVAAKLIKTVIDLTKSKPDYKAYWNDLDILGYEIDKNIYPELQKLMQDDSNQFDIVIKTRNSRNEAEDIVEKARLSQKALDELKVSITIPLDIARQCLRLGQIAVFVFDKGFKSARGDSSVGINSTIGAIAGCLSIVDLNLQSLINDKWSDQARIDTDKVRSEYNDLVSEGMSRAEELTEEANRVNSFYTQIDAIRKSIQNNANLTSTQLEVAVRDIHLTMHEYREVIWKKDVPDRPLDLLKPEKLLSKLGYQYKLEDNLGVHDEGGNKFEVAGLIDSEKKYVAVSKNFPKPTQLFTIAHELGHALLHPGQSLHRDRPIDGSQVGLRDPQEIQANKFAGFFLMPRKQVIDVFRLLFGKDKFSINEYTAMGFNIPIAELRKKCPTLRDLSRLLATTDFFYRPINPLTNQFHTSQGAMAIRLEECELIEFK
jgi:formiminotetrahydrofolate cyclodeaminase